MEFCHDTPFVCSTDKSAIHTNRFKSENFPFEYIAVDDLHYYRRRKPCNCNKSVVSFFTINLARHLHVLQKWLIILNFVFSFCRSIWKSHFAKQQKRAVFPIPNRIQQELLRESLLRKASTLEEAAQPIRACMSVRKFTSIKNNFLKALILQILFWLETHTSPNLQYRTATTPNMARTFRYGLFPRV